MRSFIHGGILTGSFIVLVTVVIGFLFNGTQPTNFELICIIFGCFEVYVYPTKKV